MAPPSESGTKFHFVTRLFSALYHFAICSPDRLLSTQSSSVNENPCTEQDLTGKVQLQKDHYIAIGEYADLWIGQLDDRKVAVKILRGASSNNPAFVRKFTQNLQSEARKWQELNHPNVSKFLGLAYNFGYMPALVLPFYSQGNVLRFLKDKNDTEKLQTVKEIARGLDYLHQNDMVHGDIRSSNILVDEYDRACLCDVGLSLLIEPSEFVSSKTARACRWTAPEIMSPPEDLEPISDSASPFTFKSDIYAFAMTLIEIFTNKVPFSPKKDDSSVIFSVLTGGRPPIPPLSRDTYFVGEVIESCWKQDPKLRPTSRAVLETLDRNTIEDIFLVASPSKSSGTRC